MAEHDVTQISGTSLKTIDYKHDSVSSDLEHDKESYWDFPDSEKYNGFYFKNPHLKKAIDALAYWCTSRGYEVPLASNRAILDKISGIGEDSFLTWARNMLIQKKVQGDAFSEIIRNDQGNLINLKPLTAEKMKVYYNSKGVITKYGYLQSGKPEQIISKDRIFHTMNDRVFDQPHGTSVIECLEWILNAIQEAMRDYRIVIHRNVIPVRIIEIDEDDATARDEVLTEYKNQIKNGDVIVVSKGTIDIKDHTVTVTDPVAWIRYLENAFYLAVGVPRVVLGGSSEHTESAAKTDYLIFEEVYNKEQYELEQDIWNQLAIRIKFNKPASLQNNMATGEAANTGQVGFQPNDLKVNPNRQ